MKKRSPERDPWLTTLWFQSWNLSGVPVKYKQRERKENALLTRTVFLCNVDWFVLVFRKCFSSFIFPPSLPSYIPWSLLCREDLLKRNMIAVQLSTLISLLHSLQVSQLVGSAKLLRVPTVTVTFANFVSVRFTAGFHFTYSRNWKLTKRFHSALKRNKTLKTNMSYTKHLRNRPFRLNVEQNRSRATQNPWTRKSNKNFTSFLLSFAKFMSHLLTVRRECLQTQPNMNTNLNTMAWDERQTQ